MIVYRTHSVSKTVTMNVCRLLIIAVIIEALRHYRENPTVTVTVAAVSMLLLLLSAGEEEIIVYERGLQYTNYSVLKRWRKKRFFEFKDIQDIRLTGNYDGRYWARMPNEIEIILADGSSKKFRTTIYITKLEKVKQAFYKHR